MDIDLVKELKELGGTNWSKMITSPPSLAGRSIAAMQNHYRGTLLPSFKQKHGRKAKRFEELLAWLEQLDKEGAAAPAAAATPKATTDETTDSSGAPNGRAHSSSAESTCAPPPPPPPPPSIPPPTSRKRALVDTEESSSATTPTSYPEHVLNGIRILLDHPIARELLTVVPIQPSTGAISSSVRESAGPQLAERLLAGTHCLCVAPPLSAVPLPHSDVLSMLMGTPCHERIPSYAQQFFAAAGDEGTALMQLLDDLRKPIKVCLIPRDEGIKTWVRGDTLVQRGGDWTLILAVRQCDESNNNTSHYGALLQLAYSGTSPALEYEVLAPEGSLRLFIDGITEVSARKGVIPTLPKHLAVLTRHDRCIVYIGEPPSDASEPTNTGCCRVASK